jgi:hypothetical protein
MSNKKLMKYIGKVEYDDCGGYIRGVGKNGDHQMIADIGARGWGATQNTFKSEEEAEQFQDEVGRFIADAINEKLERDFEEVSHE